MNLPITAGFLLSFGDETHAVSPLSGSIAAVSEEEMRQFFSSATFRPAHTESLRELLEVSRECSRSGWDGNGGEPVRPRTRELAHRLILALPASVSSPSVGAEPSGYVTLEWSSSPTRVLSVSVSHEGRIYFAFLNGEEKERGSQPVTLSLPPKILELARRITGDSHEYLIAGV